MAERRMMSKKIIHSDAFLDMPATSQNLYFHLLLEADDEGFVNSPKRIQRTVGASDGDAQMLIAKKFVITFDSGVVVIKHWRIHNYIQSDRFKSTTYVDERSMLSIDKNDGYKLDTKCTPSIGKDRLVEDSREKNVSTIVEFSFTLKTKKPFSSLSDEYKDNLEAKIKASGLPLDWTSFRDACIANGYKYQNFWLAYQNSLSKHPLKCG